VTEATKYTNSAVVYQQFSIIHLCC